MTSIRETLSQAGLRPTRQREIIGARLFTRENRHFTAENLFRELLADQERVSLATIYNTLGAFTAAGLLRTVTVDSGRLFYDTNTEPHYHLYDETGLELTDIAPEGISITGLPELQDGEKIQQIDIIVRTAKN